MTDGDFDIHLTWSIKDLIRRIGPEKAIRELKKRCDAGAIIGCTLYKGLIERWLDVALTSTEKAERGPAEEFMLASGEDVWVQRVEELHEKYPRGIPRVIQMDLIDEFNADLERRVGRKIPLQPNEASKEDIAESKRIVGLMARQMPVTPPEAIEKEIPPAPPKEKEAPKPEAVTAPAEPLIPVPKEPGKEVPRLDLMKGEIEERIRKMKGEKARGELKAGEGNGDDRAMKVMEKKISELPYAERRKLAKMIAATIEGKKPEEEVEYITIDELMKLPVEKRRELLKKIAGGETEVKSSVVHENGKDEDELREPRDYTQWTFADFEGLITGLEDIEDLVELREFIDVSEKLTETDAEALRNIVKTRIAELTKGYAGLV